MDRQKQLASFIFHNTLAVMKNALSLEELSYRESGRNDPRYRTFKKHLMEFTYSTLRDTFDELEDWGVMIKTDNDEDVRNGYKDSISGGSGFLNSEKFDEWLGELDHEKQ